MRLGQGSARMERGGGVGLGGAGGWAAAVGVGVGGGWAVRGEIRPAATRETRSTNIRYRGIPTNSIRSFTRMAGPNCNLYFARRGLLPSGGTTSTFQSAWSFRSRSATSWIRPSWKSWTEERKVTATMASLARTGAPHIKFMRATREEDLAGGSLPRPHAVPRGLGGRRSRRLPAGGTPPPRLVDAG